MRNTVLLKLFITLLSAFWVSCGVIIIIYRFKSKKRCTEKVRATIVSKELVRIRGKKYGKRNPRCIYNPIFSYKYDDTEYQESCNYCGFYNIGKELEIFIDPNEPKDIYLPQNTVFIAIISITIILIGALPGILMLISIYNELFG